MRATDKFQDFLTDFLYLAGEAKIPAIMYKDELYQRMTWKLQEITIKESMDGDIDFDAYTGICTKLADHLVVINESRNQDRQRGQSNTPIPRTTENTGASTSRREARRREDTPTSGTASASRTTAEELPPEKRELFRSGKCFYCEIFGHIARDCPRKRMEREMKPTPEQSKKEEP
jgi:zinc knuckle protein